MFYPTILLRYHALDAVCSLGRVHMLQVWSMKAPIWEFQYGDEMAKINASSARSHLYLRFFIISLQGFHDAVGFKNVRTGLNYTMEWCTPWHLPTLSKL